MMASAMASAMASVIRALVRIEHRKGAYDDAAYNFPEPESARIVRPLKELRQGRRSGRVPLIGRQP